MCLHSNWLSVFGVDSLRCRISTACSHSNVAYMILNLTWKTLNNFEFSFFFLPFSLFCFYNFYVNFDFVVLINSFVGKMDLNFTNTLTHT